MDKRNERLRKSFGKIAEYTVSIESNGGRIHSISPEDDTFVVDDVLRVRFRIEVPQLAGLPSGGNALAGDGLTVTDDGTALLEFVVSVPLSDSARDGRPEDQLDESRSRERSDRVGTDDSPVPTGDTPKSDPDAAAATEVDEEATTGGSTVTDSDGTSSPATAATDDATDDEGEAEPDDPYRDPERLAAVYEEYETFREMRDALGVDVTPQTVRRHMIDHGIHEVSPNPSVELQRRAAASEAATGSRSESESGSGSESESEPDPLDSRSGEEDRPESPPIEGDGGTPVPEGLDLPADVTVAAVKDAVKRSRTVREAQHRLGIDEAETRAILRELDLLDLVIGRINTDGRSEPTDAELDERIRNAVAENE